jgi:hypothetical protein
VWFIYDDLDRYARHLREFLKKPQVVFVFFYNPAVDGLNLTVLDGGKDCD